MNSTELQHPVPALSVQDLSVRFGTGPDVTDAVRSVSFSIQPGETVALLGESGSGKSTLARAVMGLLPSGACRFSAISLELQGLNLLSLRENDWTKIRGRKMSMIFQNARTSLDPVKTIGRQLTALFRRLQGQTAREARESVTASLLSAGFPDTRRIAESYAHQLSGGMNQRIMVAMALACRPAVLLADEPTSALDVTTQAQIMQTLAEKAQDTGTAVLLITHDLGLAAQYASRCLVMRRGKLLEDAPVSDLFNRPAHPYSQELVRLARSNTPC